MYRFLPHVKISLLFETMVKVLLFFLALVVASSYLTDIMIDLPLNLLAFLQWVFGYIPLAVGLMVLIWFFGE